MRVFVTGGTGLLGNTVLRHLTQQGHDLIALVRGQIDDKVFDGIRSEFVSADLAGLESGDSNPVSEAISGCDAVIHSAGLIHIGRKRLEESMRVNRDGTKMIVEACLKHDCKLVHVGTVNTIAVGTKQAPSNEETPLDHAGGQVSCAYVDSKRAGLEEVNNAVANGLRATVVHPGFMLGPWDWKPSSGRMMLEIAKNFTPIAPSGGCSLCDSRDVADATIAAIDKGGDDGRQYILAGHNWTYRKIWTEMSERMNVLKPVMSAGPIQNWLGAVGGDLIAKFVKKEPDINGASVKISTQYHWYDCSRAKEELGYVTRPASETLDACAEWIREHHL